MKHQLQHIIRAAAVLLFAVLCVSCVTSRKLTDKTQKDIDQRDSVRAEYVYRVDTVFVEVLVRDSTSTDTEKQTDMGIQFVPEGGSFNTNTGQADGVLNVKMTEQVKQLESRITNLQAELNNRDTQITELTDSIGVLRDLTKNDIKETDTQKSLWWVWLTSGALLMLILIIVLKRIPYTAWLVSWI